MDTLFCYYLRDYSRLFFGLAQTEWIAVVIVIGAVLSAEAINSSIESLADLVSPEYNEAIKKTKDLAAGAVLIMAIAAAIVGSIIFFLNWDSE